MVFGFCLLDENQYNYLLENNKELLDFEINTEKEFCVNYKKIQEALNPSEPLVFY